MPNKLLEAPMTRRGASGVPCGTYTTVKTIYETVKVIYKTVTARNKTVKA